MRIFLDRQGSRVNASRLPPVVPKITSLFVTSIHGPPKASPLLIAREGGVKSPPYEELVKKIGKKKHWKR